MAIILIGGGTGLIGLQLSRMLRKEGHEVRHLSRNKNLNAEFPAYQWDMEKGIYDKAAAEGIHHLINLAGAGIGDKRWTTARKQLLISSRLKSTALCQTIIEDARPSLATFIAGSAIGYYGNREDKLLLETNSPGAGFLSEVVQEWEQAIQEVKTATNIRTCIIRTGIVLSLAGGALPKMLLPLKGLISPYFGNGQGWYSWIHLDDICRLILFCIQDKETSGIYNGVAPFSVQHKTFANALLTAKNQVGFSLSVPSATIKLALGEMSHTILDSTKCSAQKLLDAGFEFRFPTLDSALENLIENK